MAKYSWTITKVFHDDDQRCVGVVGPRHAHLTHDEILAHPERRRFRLSGDDQGEEGNVFAEGYYVGPDDETKFAPLDDYGEGNWGAVTIEYWESGKGGGWKQL